MKRGGLITRNLLRITKLPTLASETPRPVRKANTIASVEPIPEGVNGIAEDRDQAKAMKHAITNLKKTHHFCDTDLVVVVAGNFGRSAGASYIEIGSLENLLGASNV
mgnify:CR=1 FL=1